MSPDSVTYLSAARNLYAGHGYTDFTGQWLTNFPPGYPAALATGHLLGFSFTTSERLVNATSFAAIVALGWILIRRHTSSGAIRVGATLLLATSPALVRIADNAWSEPMFCALVLAFLVVLEDALGEGRDRWLPAAGLLAAMAFLVRYAGVALVVVGVISLVVSSRRAPWRRLVGRLAIFLGGAASLPALWVLQNATSGTPAVLGPRVSAGPDLVSFADRFFVSFSAALLAVLAAVTVTRERRARQTLIAARSPLLAFIVVYTVMVILSGKLAGASVDARIDSPMYVPVIVVVVGVFDFVLARVRRIGRDAWRRPIAVVLASSAIAYLGLSGLAFANDAWADGRTARGYGSSLSESPLVDAVETLPPGVPVATNGPWALYALTGHQPIVPSPGQTAPELSLLPETIPQLAELACEGPVYLAWFTDLGLQWPYPPTTLATTVRLDVVHRSADGILYAVHPLVVPCPDR